MAISLAVAGMLESSVSSVRESEIERAFIPCSDSNGDMPVIELGVWFQHADISGRYKCILLYCNLDICLIHLLRNCQHLSMVAFACGL